MMRCRVHISVRASGTRRWLGAARRLARIFVTAPHPVSCVLLRPQRIVYKQCQCVAIPGGV